MKIRIRKSNTKKRALLKLAVVALLMNLGVCCSTIQKSNQLAEVTSLELDISIPAGANSWVVDSPNKTDLMISDTGISNWNSQDVKIRTYFRTENTGKIHLGLDAKVASGLSKLKLTFNGISKEVSLSNTSSKNIPVGVFNISDAGYQFVELEGITKTATEFARVKALLIGGEATKGPLYYVKDDVYWGRRGPSVHLSYSKPEAAKNIEWFYNEMTIPEGEDVIGSYFMANGFGEGYLGIQVNSEKERRILFSVWSAFSTDDPNEIPEDYKVQTLGVGPDVRVQDFGDEGSGSQSIRVFKWKSGITYKFLVKAVPSENNSTDYTAYFYAPEIGKWQLISSLRRPKTSTYLVRPHSFVENFIPSMGDRSRKVSYTNQWLCDSSGTWHEMVKAKFTADATARKDARLDYAGGIEGDGFYLRNGGFFSERQTIDTYFSRPEKSIKPKIRFEELPKVLLLNKGDIVALDRSNWKAIDFSSQELHREVSHVFDNNPNTFWHSRWSADATSYPHYFTIDMTERLEVGGFLFVQRSKARRMKTIEIYVSNDAVNWEHLGNYQLMNTNTVQHLDLGKKVKFRYFKIVGNTAFDGLQFAAMAEVMCYN